jgi:hypothetical protein
MSTILILMRDFLPIYGMLFIVVLAISFLVSNKQNIGFRILTYAPIILFIVSLILIKNSEGDMLGVLLYGFFGLFLFIYYPTLIIYLVYSYYSKKNVDK